MKLLISLLFILFFTKSNGQSILLPTILSDNMVLQQQSEISVWGKTAPGDEITVKSSWDGSVKTTISDDGSWITKIKTPSAGGPYQLTIQSKDTTIIIKNVLIGEVWLCSGQSNMEMQLEGDPPMSSIQNSEVEIKNASYPEIRLFTVGKNISVESEFNCSGEWNECNSATSAKFSAVAYFFGKKLFQELKIPIGLICSSWGGTPVQAWTSEKYLKKNGRFDSTLKLLNSSKSEIIGQREWIKSHPFIDVSKIDKKERWRNLDFNDEECGEPGFNDDKWVSISLPQLWESTSIGNFDGAVWFRKKIEIPKDWINKDLILELGPIDDVDRTYVNGELVGKTEEEQKWQLDRFYDINKEIVQSTTLIIAVRVIDYGGGGGLYGERSKLKIYQPDKKKEILLAGNWKVLPVAEYINTGFYVYGSKDEEYFSRPEIPMEVSANKTPTLLYNAMIVPLIPFQIKGSIWYQGEENTKEPELYRKLFPLMIKNWRDDRKEEFPFYFVQIAPFDYGPSVKSELLRESQFLTLSIPNTGMAVTLDIGEPYNIHPANKKDVGERLALWALAKNYNKEIPYSGPLYKSMEIDRDKIILSFDYSESGLILRGDNPEENFLIAGEDKKFVKANVRINGKQLIVYNEQISKPVAVRYAWANYVKANLFNSEGLPASSFRTDDWEN